MGVAGLLSCAFHKASRSISYIRFNKSALKTLGRRKNNGLKLFFMETVTSFVRRRCVKPGVFVWDCPERDAGKFVFRPCERKRNGRNFAFVR